MKTNATHILDDLGVPYTLREYEVDPDLSAETVASKIGLPAEQVFKTLVARGDRGGVYLTIIPGNMELDGKALARVTGDRRVELVPLREVQKLTGYIRGGVTALGGKRDYPVYADETIELFEVISISAGVEARRFCWRPPTTCALLTVPWWQSQGTRRQVPNALDSWPTHDQNSRKIFLKIPLTRTRL